VVEGSLIGPTSVIEGDTTTNYTVSFSEPVPIGKTVTVNLAYTGTAADGTDFTGVASVVVTGPANTATFTLATLDDALADNAETIIVDIDSIDDVSNAFEVLVEGSNNQVTTTINDSTGGDATPGPEDQVEVSLTGPASVIEGDTTTAYTVTLEQAVPAGNSVTVNLAYTGTAADGTDFTGVASVLVTGGNTSTTFTLATLDDALADNAETIIIDIDSIVDTDSSFEAMVEGTSNQVTTTITDDVDVVSIDLAGPTSLTEGGAAGTYTVSLKDAGGGSISAVTDVTVALSYTGVAVDGTDFSGVADVTIGGGNTTGTFDISALADGLIEGIENFTVTLGAITGGAEFESLVIDTAKDDMTTSIADIDSAVLIVDDVTVSEADGTATFTVALSQAVAGGFSVDYTLADGTATGGGVDYTSTGGTINFAGTSGETQTIVVPITDDFIADNSETFTVSLSASTGLVDDSDTATGTINDDVDNVEVSLTGPVSVIEGETTTDYTVTLDQAVPAGKSVTVNLAYTGTAADGADFTGVASVVVTGGNTSTTFTLATLDDALADNAETIIVDIDSIVDTNNSFEALVEGVDRQVTTSISDLTDNTPPVNTVPGDQTVDEDSPLDFTGGNVISVTGVEGLASTQLTVVNGTLNLTLSGTATISAGEIGSSTLTISGSETDINDTLTTLSYQGLENFVGLDTLTVLSTNNDGGPFIDSDTVLINVIQSNDPAIFGGDISGSGEEDGGNITGTLTVTDPADGVSLPRFAMMTSASNGAVSLDASTGVWTYTPNADFNGPDSFTVSITDDHGNVETQVISLVVTPEQDAFDDAVATKVGLAVTDTVLSNDRFENVPVYTINGNASSGKVLDNGGGQFTYTPAANFAGTDSFSYEVTSGGVTETAIVTITVTPETTQGEVPVVLQGVTPPNPTPVSVAVVGSDSTPPTTSSLIVKDTTAVDIVRIFGNSAEDVKINPITLRGPLADQVVTEGFKEYVISDGEFDSGSGKKLSYEALLSTGEPLPDYIKFDVSTRTFTFDADLAKLSGIENVEIRVVARDPDGNRISTSFEVEFREVESTDSGSGSEDSDSLVDGDRSVASKIDGELFVEDGSEAVGQAGDGAGMEGEPAIEEQDAQPIRLAIELADQYVQTDILRYSIADTFISTLGDNLKIFAQMEDGSDLPEYIVFDEKSEEFIINGELANELGIESVVIRVLAIDSYGNSSSDSFLIEFEPEIVQDDAAVQADVDPVASRTEVPGVSYQIMSLDGANFEQIFAKLLETMSSDVDVDESEEENQTKEDLNSQIARAGEFGYQQDKLELSELLKKIFK
jgi:hypothetical protein